MLSPRLFSALCGVVLSEEVASKTIFAVGKSKAVDELTSFISPEEFYEKYGKPGVPVLFKGVAKDMPAFKLWKDSYLLEKFGDRKVLVEEGYGHDEHIVQGAENETSAGASKPKTVKIKDFLANYTTQRIVATESLPRSMAQHVFLPPVLNCGGHQAGMHSTSLWWSNFATKSKVHIDDYDGFNCAFSGTKRWAMWHSEETKKIKKKDMGWVRSATCSGASGCADKVDVTNVDLAKFPGWDTLEHTNALVEAGDCLFVPEEWAQTVWAEGAGPWLSTTVWWGAPTSFDPRSCYRLEERGFDVKSFLSTLRDCNYVDSGAGRVSSCTQRLKMPAGEERDARFFDVSGYCDPDQKVLPEHDVSIKKYLAQLDETPQTKETNATKSPAEANTSTV